MSHEQNALDVQAVAAAWEMTDNSASLRENFNALKDAAREKKRGNTRLQNVPLENYIQPLALFAVQKIDPNTEHYTAAILALTALAQLDPEKAGDALKTVGVSIHDKTPKITDMAFWIMAVLTPSAPKAIQDTHIDGAIKDLEQQKGCPNAKAVFLSKTAENNPNRFSTTQAERLATLGIVHPDHSTSLHLRLNICLPLVRHSKKLAGTISEKAKEGTSSANVFHKENAYRLVTDIAGYLSKDPQDAFFAKTLDCALRPGRQAVQLAAASAASALAACSSARATKAFETAKAALPAAEAYPLLARLFDEVAESDQMDFILNRLTKDACSSSQDLSHLVARNSLEKMILCNEGLAQRVFNRAEQELPTGPHGEEKEATTLATMVMASRASRSGYGVDTVIARASDLLRTSKNDRVVSSALETLVASNGQPEKYAPIAPFLVKQALDIETLPNIRAHALVLLKTKVVNFSEGAEAAAQQLLQEEPNIKDADQMHAALEMSRTLAGHLDSPATIEKITELTLSIMGKKYLPKNVGGAGIRAIKSWGARAPHLFKAKHPEKVIGCATRALRSMLG